LGRPRKFQRTVAAVERVASAKSISEAARDLDVDRSTIHRWIKDGKVKPPRARRRLAGNGGSTLNTGVESPISPADWAGAVRGTYDLSESEQELVNLGMVALGMAKDVALKPEIRLAAAARFAALLRQLDLETEVDVGAAETITSHTRWPRRVG
jgi:transposase-like protein